MSNPIFDAMTLLASCLCAQIIADGSGEVCFCGVMPGDTPALDYVVGCDSDACGMAWVRLGAANPASGIGVTNNQPGNCASGLGLEVEMGIIRCAPFGDDDGNPPPATEMLAAAELQIADLFTMRRAVACCDRSIDWILGTYSPIGPTGGAIGGIWSLSLLVF